MLGCYVGSANENDRYGATVLLSNMQKEYTTIKQMWADMGYQSKDLKGLIKEKYNIDLEIVPDFRIF